MKSEVVKFTTYSIIERLLITLVNMVSIVIIGRLGSAELSGMSISNTIINILQAPFLAISTGAVISVSANEKNKEEITLNIKLLTTIVSVILMCVVAGFSKQLIFLFQTPRSNVRTRAFLYCRSLITAFRIFYKLYRT